MFRLVPYETPNWVVLPCFLRQSPTTARQRTAITLSKRVKSLRPCLRGHVAVSIDGVGVPSWGVQGVFDDEVGWALAGCGDDGAAVGGGVKRRHGSRSPARRRSGRNLLLPQEPPLSPMAKRFPFPSAPI